MAIAINSRVFRTLDDLRIEYGTRHALEVDVTVPSISDYTFRAIPEYLLHVSFGATPGSGDFTLSDWLLYDVSTLYTSVFWANGYNGIINISQGAPRTINAYMSLPPYIEERIYSYRPYRHETIVHKQGNITIPILTYTEYGEEPRLTFPYLNAAHDFTFMMDGTDTVVARYSNGVMTDVHDKMMIPPLIVENNRVDIFTIKDAHVN